ncbi:MAG TPA: glycosyltransferase family 39 protein [Ktedonobacteraceae bacterium]
MSISLDQTHSLPDKSQTPVRPAPTSTSRWLVLAYWSAIVLTLVAAVSMRLYHLDLPFDRDSYDEGVYWQSLRSMLNGQSLYSGIFYSQPPLFLLSTYPGFALFGASLWAARFSIALVSLLGFLGAYILGRTLAGRLGGLAALLLLLVDPLYLAQSQTIQAEASSVAFTLLAVAFAFLWWQQPDGRRGLCWAALCGLTFSLSLLCKLLCISTLVPIALLMLARAWQISRGKAGTSGRSWLPLLVGMGVAALTIAVALLPYAGSLKVVWADVWTFHTEAAKVAALPRIINLQRIGVALLSLTTLAALYGLLSALLRQDWRVLPVLAWLLITFFSLFNQQPLFIHHLVALEPPLITLALLGLARPAAYKGLLNSLPARVERLASFIEPEPLLKLLASYKASLVQRVPEKQGRLIFGAALILLLAACTGGFWQDVNYYQGADAYVATPLIQQNLHVANDLRQAIGPDQWVVTDGQFIAGLANRSTPPLLVDTSSVRLLTGYVTLAQLEQATINPRVHAVLFYTSRFYYIHQAAGFHAWVAARFHLLHKYGPGQELWAR